MRPAGRSAALEEGSMLVTTDYVIGENLAPIRRDWR
jgi:hypothetical protein